MLPKWYLVFLFFLNTDAISIGGILAAPFSGGASLLLTGASTAVSVGGSFAASHAQSSLDSDTKIIMKKVEDCISEIKRDQQELEAYFQDFDRLMNYFRDHGAEKIMTFAEKRECSLKGKDYANALALAKPLFDSCTSAARFLCTLKSAGTTTVVYSVLTIRFLLRKSQFLLYYVPDAVFSRAAIQHFSQLQILASVSNVATTGNQAVKVTSKMSANIVQRTQPVGRNIIMKSKEMRVVGTIHKSSRTVVKTAGTVSKLGLGLGVLSLAINTYCVIKAEEESKKHHPEYENVCRLAEEIQSSSWTVQAQLSEFNSKYDDMRLLHIQLTALIEDMLDCDELETAGDEVENVLTLLEKSAKVL